MLQWNNCNLEVKQMKFVNIYLKNKKHFPLLQLNHSLFLKNLHDNGETGHTLHVSEGSRKEQGKCTVPANLNIL